MILLSVFAVLMLIGLFAVTAFSVWCAFEGLRAEKIRLDEIAASKKVPEPKAGSVLRLIK